MKPLKQPLLGNNATLAVAVPQWVFQSYITHLNRSSVQKWVGIIYKLNWWLTNTFMNEFMNESDSIPRMWDSTHLQRLTWGRAGFQKSSGFILEDGYEHSLLSHAALALSAVALCCPLLVVLKAEPACPESLTSRGSHKPTVYNLDWSSCFISAALIAASTWIFGTTSRPREDVCSYWLYIICVPRFCSKTLFLTSVSAPFQV